MSDEQRESKQGLTKAKVILGGVLWTGVFVCAAIMWQGRSENANASSSTAQTGDTKANKTAAGKTDAVNGTKANPIEPGQSTASVKTGFPARKLPDFEFDEAMGETVSLSDLKGKPWVASFVFTRCTSTCPTITAAVMRLQERVASKNPDVMFVTFSVDPKFDTPEILKTYSETFQPIRDRWKFLSGSQQEVYELIVKGFGLYVKENLGAARMPGFEVAHSNRVVLVNEDGIPVGTFLGTKEPDMVKLRRILTGHADFPAPGPSLSISTADGSPLQIEFQVQPNEGQANAPEGNEEKSGTDNGSKEQQNQSDAPIEEAEPSDSDESTSQAVAPVDAELTAAEHNALIEQQMPAWTKRLPSINAGLNTLACLLLAAGFVAIKRGKKDVHRKMMMLAFAVSVAFLLCYLLYHYELGNHTGKHGKRFPGEGIFAAIYPLVLWPHIVLAACVPFLAVRVFQHAFAGRWTEHKRLARITFPIWMYVSVTGVIIYGMLYHWPVPAGASVSS